MRSKFVTIGFPPGEQAKFIRWVKGLSEENNRKCRWLIDYTASKIVSRSKMFAPVSFGFLKSSIGKTISQSRMGATIIAGGQGGGSMVRYAPYVEFGTGSMVIVPTDLKSYAMQFKGAGIRKVNNRAQPFFFPAVRISVDEMTKRLNQMGFK